ncbi:MAG TPA: hypothetical protein PK878_20210, partial [bacterium]|nr:hypothetical protein [bacterium]
ALSSIPFIPMMKGGDKLVNRPFRAANGRQVRGSRKEGLSFFTIDEANFNRQYVEGMISSLAS